MDYIEFGFKNFSNSCENVPMPIINGVYNTLNENGVHEKSLRELSAYVLIQCLNDGAITDGVENQYFMSVDSIKFIAELNSYDEIPTILSELFKVEIVFNHFSKFRIISSYIMYDDAVLMNFDTNLTRIFWNEIKVLSS